MADRAVYQTRKDEWGNITALGGPFGHVTHVDAIAHIEADMERYYVPLDDGSGAPVEIASGSLGKYLRTNWDGLARNNLVDLPDL
jgi:Protein of unknown function (DUF3892)